MFTDMAVILKTAGKRRRAPPRRPGPAEHRRDAAARRTPRRCPARPDTADVEDFSYERVLRLLRFVAGERASDFRGTVGIEEFSDHPLHPRGQRLRLLRAPREHLPLRSPGLGHLLLGRLGMV